MKKFFKWFGIVIGAIVLLVALFFGYLTIAEFRPKDVEEAETLDGGAYWNQYVYIGNEMSIITWNTGYGALGENADFFMDGGESVMTADKDIVKENITGIAEYLKGEKPNFIFLQEVDRKSRRSYYEDEALFYTNYLTEYDRDKVVRGQDAFGANFAYNFKVSFIPYPIPPIGKVNSGIMTLTDTIPSSSERISLPCPFKWPTRLGNLKRCMLVTRLNICDPEAGTIVDGRELVLVNLHLEAYDSGEGKALQTAQFKEFIESEIEKGNYVIAGGDFNQIFSNIDTSMYPFYEGTWHCGKIDVDEFPNNVSFIMDNSVPTCRSLDKAYKDADKDAFQYYMIDGFVVSDNIEIIKCETKDLGFKYTDHNPVVMKFKLK